MPHLHKTVANPRAWLDGTHRGVSRRHPAAYLDEFVFRHNRRLGLAAAFQTLLGLGAGRGPTTYDAITGAKDLPRVDYTPSARTRSRAARAVGDGADHNMQAPPEATG